MVSKEHLFGLANRRDTRFGAMKSRMAKKSDNHKKRQRPRHRRICYACFLTGCQKEVYAYKTT